MAPNAPCLCVNVHSEQWESMTFTANQTDKVKKINEHIRSKTKVHVQDQVLLLGSKTLKPERSLSSYGIDKEQTIHLTLKVVKPTDEELPLVLKDLDDDGRKHRLLVRRSYSVAQVKKMIEMKTGTTPEDQTVNCNGKILADGKKMADYDIRKDNFLFLTLRCHSG
ncbi:ubiquitin D [Echinops telfairi]|uniref:Ubiquitin D n=1 Tax=Echinops telfairi TaxID=9371 RepID=A0ABM0J8R9_ECHTE|nr:ubiquitin D [Echinops telfairi]